MEIQQYEISYIDWKDRQQIIYIHARTADKARQTMQMIQGFKKILDVKLANMEDTTHGN